MRKNRQSLPPFPRISFKRAEKLAVKLARNEIGRVEGQVLTGDLLFVITRDLAIGLKGRGVEVARTMVEASLSKVLGERLTRDRLNWIYNMLSVNQETLHAGEPVILPNPNTKPPKDQWLCCKVIDWSSGPSDTRKDSTDVIYTFRVVWGSWYSREFRQVCTLQQVNKFSLLFGLMPISTHKPVGLPREAVGMYLWGILGSSHSQPDKIRLSKTATNNYLENLNRDLRKRRNQRFGDDVCPRKYLHPCGLCRIGYDVCNRATHPITPRDLLKENPEDTESDQQCFKSKQMMPAD